MLWIFGFPKESRLDSVCGKSQAGLRQIAMQFAANKVAEKMTNAAMVNNSHPTENGMAKQAAAVSQLNFSAMSIEQLKEFARKQTAGEN